MKIKHLKIVASIIIVTLSACGGGGGGDSGDVNFPTPTLPAGAVIIDDANAEDIAESALLFTDILSEFALKAEGPPSIPQVIKLVTEQIFKRNRNSGSVAARETDDISASFCVSGKATDSYTETDNSVTGEFKFSDCDVGSGIIVNGTLPYEASENDATLDYDGQFGGSLTFRIGADIITIVINFSDSGNDGTGDFSLTQSFSLEGIPGGGFLVTTVKPILGNSFTDEITSGELRVRGANNTKLCITVTAINLVTVELDDGSGGGCVPLVPPLDIPI